MFDFKDPVFGFMCCRSTFHGNEAGKETGSQWQGMSLLLQLRAVSRQVTLFLFKMFSFKMEKWWNDLIFSCISLFFHLKVASVALAYEQWFFCKASGITVCVAVLDTWTNGVLNTLHFPFLYQAPSSLYSTEQELLLASDFNHICHWFDPYFREY